MKKSGIFVGPILVCFFVGYASALVQSAAIAEWYPFLNKPALTPPNFVFPLAWGILYILMGLSLGCIVQTSSRPRGKVVVLFAIQLALTFLWCLGFFALRSPAAGFLIIVLLLSVLILYAIRAWPVNKWSTVLFVPYILWVSFAAYLNAYILLYN